MDYNKIGKFIAIERKNLNLTQGKLASKLYVSEKTISKWENGNGVPDTNSLPKLCEIFNVSLNELLNGSRINAEEYKDKAEKELLNLQKQKEDADKFLIKLEIGFGLTAIASLLLMAFFASFIAEKYNNELLSIIMIITSTIIFVVSALICLKIEQKAGYYVCKKCGHKHVPTYGQVNRAMHIGISRYIKCPKCNKRSWHKKVLK